MLQQWEPLYPGITAKFVEWTDKQIAHRQGIETRRAQRSEDRQDRSQAITEKVTYLGLILAAIVGIWGSWIVGTVPFLLHRLFRLLTSKSFQSLVHVLWDSNKMAGLLVYVLLLVDLVLDPVHDFGLVL